MNNRNSICFIYFFDTLDIGNGNNVEDWLDSVVPEYNFSPHSSTLGKSLSNMKLIIV